MHAGRKPDARRVLRLLPVLVVLAATLVVVAAGNGGTGTKQLARPTKA